MSGQTSDQSVYTLRAMRRDDCEELLTWRNQPSVRAVSFSSTPISLSEHLGWYEKASADPRQALLVFEAPNMRLGHVKMSWSVGGVAKWSFFKNPAAPTGTGKRMCTAAVRHGFSSLDLFKIWGEVIDHNGASISLHRKLGFAEEGIFRHQHFSGTDYHSVIRFGLLKEDWTPRAI